MKRRLWIAILLLLLVLGGALAQRGRSRRSYDRGGVPRWENPKEFAKDVFTFVRIQYSDYGGYGGYGGGRGYGRRGARGGGRWRTDYPESDLNFSFRLQQLTAMEVNPDGVILRLTDPELFNYPFIYIVEPGRLQFTEAEVRALRQYLLGGGFLMVDDFWGDDEWYNFYDEIKRVFPNRPIKDIPLSHEIFNAVFVLKEKPQIPSIMHALRGRSQGITWQGGPDTRQVHYKMLEDDKGRIMAVICHNTDLGDGWEEEGVDEWYFREFSEKKAYPLGINIVFYAMTH